jgi:hypothetical protein
MSSLEISKAESSWYTILTVDEIQERWKIRVIEAKRAYEAKGPRGKRAN